LLEKEISIAIENIELLTTMEQIAIARFKSGGQSRECSGSPATMESSVNMKTVNSGSGMIGMDARGQTSAESSSTSGNSPQMGEMTKWTIMEA